MLIEKPVGIVGYGSCLPQQAVSLSEIEQGHGKKVGSVSRSLQVEQKTVPALDEDTITIAVAAGMQALTRLEGYQKAGQGKRKKRAQNNTKEGFSKDKIGAVFIGSESHPYAVNPSGTVVAQALGLSSSLALVDLEFACKAGTQGMQICASYILSGMAKYALAIGADTAQAEPGDALEYTASAGGAAYVFGSQGLLAELQATNSMATDTPDFWRRPGENYPQHGGRFTGEPAYFKHVLTNTKRLLEEVGLKPVEIDYCVFHTPNGKFPRRAAKKLGFTNQQLKPSLIVEKIGNTYAGAVPLALAAVLDQAQAGQTILVTAYGSGAGADSFLFKTTPLLVKQRKNWSELVKDQIRNLKTINYQQYLKLMQGRQH